MNYKDKYNNDLNIGDTVIFASVNRSCHNQAYLNEGIIIEFCEAPSFKYAYVKTIKNRITKKDINQLVKI